MNQLDQSVTDSRELWLREHLATLWRGKWIILLVTALAFGGALFYTVRQTPTYVSETRTLVETVNLANGTQIVPIMDTEKQIAESPAVGLIAKEILKSKEAVDELLDNVSVDSPLDTQILIFTYSAPDAEQARSHARAFANAYLNFRTQRLGSTLGAPVRSLQDRIRKLHNRYLEIGEDLENATSGAQRDTLIARRDSILGQIAVLQEQAGQISPSPGLSSGQVVQPARLPAGPSSPSYPLNLTLAVILGLAVGVGAVLLRERLNDRVRGRVDLERFSGVPVLAVLPAIPKKYRLDPVALWTDSNLASTTVEAYRTLRAGLLFAASSRGAKTILVTSSRDGEGKTTVAANLGAVLSEADKRVVLVSGDLRRPQLEEVFACVATTGVTEVVSGQVKVLPTLVDVPLPRLKLLPTGRLPGNKTQLLGSKSMERLLLELRNAADVVIIDAAPVLGTSDTLALAAFVDAVLFVADPERTDRHTVVRARRQLDLVNAPLLGSVLNRFDEERLRYPTYFTYSAQPDGRAGLPRPPGLEAVAKDDRPREEETAPPPPARLKAAGQADVPKARGARPRQ